MAGDLLCAIHQPNLFPRLSTLAKLFTADVWIVLNDVQFARRDYQHRCRLAAADDPTTRQWLTLPVHLPDGRTTLIKDVRLVNPVQARRRTERLLKQYYRRSLHWAAVHEAVATVLETLETTDELAAVAEQSTRAMLTALSWAGTVCRSSDLSARTERSERLADLTIAVGARTYLCGSGGARYLEHQPFEAQGLSTALFSTPVSGEARIWHDARAITGLHPLATAGPERLVQELRSRGRRQRPAQALLDAG